MNLFLSSFGLFPLISLGCITLTANDLDHVANAASRRVNFKAPVRPLFLICVLKAPSAMRFQGGFGPPLEGFTTLVKVAGTEELAVAHQ